MIVLRVLGFLWSLPVTLLGLLVCLICRPWKIKWEDGAIEVDVRWLWMSNIVAVTLGHVILYRTEERGALRAHERVHVFQCDLLGPLVFLVYPIASLVALAGGGQAYRDNAFERWARSKAGR